jgi:Icc protein
VAPGQTLLQTDTEATLEQVLTSAFAEIDTHQCDAIIASGDLAHTATEAVYRRFHAIIARYFAGPLLCLPGNHDVLQAMQAAELPMRSIVWPDWQLLALDSHEDDKPKSLIVESDRQALATAVAGTSANHVLLATHHPLVELQCPWLDKDRIVGPLELLRWLDSICDQRLRGAVFGHAHQEVQGKVGAWPVFGVPSTCFQFQPQSPSFALDDLAPGYQWLQLQDDGKIIRTVRRTVRQTVRKACISED